MEWLRYSVAMWTVGVDMGDLPEPWNAAAERAGVRQTLRGIADEAGISHVTVRRLIAEGRTSPKTIRLVAAALRVDESKVYGWAGVPVSQWGPWDPPREAHQMSPRVRAAMEELIRAVTEGGQSDAGTAEAEKSMRVIDGGLAGNDEWGDAAAHDGGQPDNDPGDA